MSQLDELRREIDRIDGLMLDLFMERMDVAARVAEYKRQENIPILNAAREQEILERRANECRPELKDETIEFFSTLMSLSRDWQAKLIGGENG